MVEQLRAVGLLFKFHYQTQETDSTPEPASRSEVNDALTTLGESSLAAVGTIGDVFKDPGVRAEVRETAGLFFDALGVSFSELGADLSKRTETVEPVGRPSSEVSGESSDAGERHVAEEEEE